LVLGHTDCGAVKGACDNITLGHLTQTLQHLSPALKATTGFSESMQNSANLAYVMQVTRYNVQLTVTKILNESPVLRELVEKQKLMVVAGIYNTATGKVDFL
jgi:carbonic anhydrase